MLCCNSSKVILALEISKTFLKRLIFYEINGGVLSQTLHKGGGWVKPISDFDD